MLLGVLLDIARRQFLERPLAALGLLLRSRVLATGDGEHRRGGEHPGVGEADKPAAKAEQDAAAPPANASDRLFVTIAALGAVLAPAERLRNIYPRYVEAQATAGPDGLAFLPFRAGTPYQGEDLVYLGEQPEQFFARCTRPNGPVRGTCIYERSLDAAEITLRFPREWLEDWRGLAAGFDRLLAQLHP